MARDYYGILGVDRNASDADIKKAFRRKARKYHPDVNDSAEAADKFNELKIAQEVLTDPQKRSIVDAGGDPEAQPNYGGAGGFGGGGLGDISSSSSVVREQECVGRNRACAPVTTPSSA